MRNNKFQIRRPINILLIVFSFYGYLLYAGQSLGSMVTNLVVPANTFLMLTNGASVAAVRDTFGIAARHEFTVSRDKREYILISCLAGMNDNIDDSSDFCLLFCDKTLIKIISPVPAELERYPYQGTTATRIKSWDIEDTKRVVNAINAPALTHAQIIDDLQPYNGKSMSLNVLPAFLLTGYFEKMTPRIRKDYATNQEFLQHYDGCRANLGMSAGQVETIFGKPLRIFPTINGQIVRIFGNNIDLQVNSAYLFSCVAVVFDRQERVLAIYSQDFFNDDWKK